jgi:hypothetical protein
MFFVTTMQKVDNNKIYNLKLKIFICSHYELIQFTSFQTIVQ